jgi:hypothetical protein
MSAEVAEPEPETLEVVATEEADVEIELELPSEPLVIEVAAPEPEAEEVTIEVDEAEPMVIELEAAPDEEPVEVNEAEPIAVVHEVAPDEELAEVRVEPEPTPEQDYALDEETPIEIVEDLKEDVYEASAHVEPEPEPVVYDEPTPEPEPEKVPLKMEPKEMEEMRVEFAPDPLTKEVMDSLAKNITLKIRLVKLLKDSQVKEETFKKLFDSYVEQGKLWVSRRDEIIKRFMADIDRMENALVTARKDHELLEIRKSIGDADQEEYKVKAPAYKWDIEHLDKEIKNRKGGIVYVSDLKSMVPDVEIHELERMAETDYGELEGIEAVSQDTLTSMKEALRTAWSSLTSPPT